MRSSILHDGMKEIVLHRGETREWVLLNEPDCDWHVVQEEGSSLRLHMVCLPEQALPNAQWNARIEVEHVGAGCRTELYGMGIVRDRQEVHTTTRVLHTVGGGFSSQLFKYVLDHEARGSFRGELKIQPAAQKVEAYQINRNILLSRAAQMTTEPQLEIYADDVKASHGATTGQLDDTAIFYMQQRCLDRATAYRLLLCAFFDDVVQKVSDSTLREQLIRSIEQTLATR